MGWYGGPYRRGRMHRGGFWIWPLVFIGMSMFFTRGFFFFLPMLAVLGVLAVGAYFFLRPMMGQRPNPYRDYDGRWGYDEKPKHDWDEKPKRDSASDPRYVVSEDGEPLEVIEDEPKAKHGDDPIDYV